MSARRSVGGVGDTPESFALLRQIVAEVVVVAQARGVPLTAERLTCVLNMVRAVPPAVKPPLLVDLERGNRVEVGALHGGELGVPTPASNFVTAALTPLGEWTVMTRRTRHGKPYSANQGGRTGTGGETWPTSCFTARTARKTPRAR